MKIRLVRDEDIDVLVDIWYKGSLRAHDFIDANYWQSQIEAMRTQYIPMAETYVATKKFKVVGFISMVDDFLAAIFIDVPFRNGGVGKELLNFVKARRDKIQLKVYQENLSAVIFYKQNGFLIKSELKDEQTNQQEYLMEWSKQ